MTIFCITGINPTHLKWTEELLASAGMDVAAPSLQNQSITFDLWHEKSLDLKNGRINDPNENQPIGRLWDQLAGELFLSNINKNCWGWTNQRSGFFLKYWRNFDPSINFIFVY